MLLSPASSRAQEPTYTVQPGDDCRSIAVRVYGRADAIGHLHEQNPDLGPLPHELEPGRILRTPPLPEPARLSAIQRRVEQRLPDAQEFGPAAQGQPLPRGSQVRTFEASSAEILFADRARVTVRERTLVIVFGGEQRVRERTLSRAELESGALRSRLGELAGQAPLDVRTPTSEASLPGDAVVRVESDGTSQISNHSGGIATVRAGRSRVRLPAGTGTVVRRGQAPSAPRPLLDAPRWRADTSGPVLGVLGLGATLRGGFTPVAGAARYRVEVARRPDGGELVSALELPARSDAFEAPGVPAGTFYVSVATIDEAGLEGRRSPWRAFTVRLARVIEPGGSERPLGPELLVVPGTWVVAPAGLACRDAEGPQSAIVTLRETGDRMIACRDRDIAYEPLLVRVSSIVLSTESRLTRDRSTELRVVLRGARLPDPTAIVLDVPVGVRAGRPSPRVLPSVEGLERLELAFPVTAPVDASDPLALAIAVTAGSERVPLASLEVPLDAPIGDPEPARAGERRAAPPPRASRIVTGALGDLAQLSLIGLRDAARRGVGAWAYGALLGEEPQVRVGAGARATIPETPLRLGFASQFDLQTAPVAGERRGDGDLVVGAGALLAEAGEGSLALDLTMWIPTRPAPEGFGRVRLVPSLEAAWHPHPLLALRTRQGMLIDASETGARAWAFAVGADLVPVEWLALGLELDAAVGALVGLEGALLALGGGVELRVEWLEIALGVRVALTDEARVSASPVAGVLSLRAFSR